MKIDRLISKALENQALRQVKNGNRNLEIPYSTLNTDRDIDLQDSIMSNMSRPTGLKTSIDLTNLQNPTSIDLIRLSRENMTPFE